MPNISERKTNAPIRSVGFEFNKPVASADVNEMQSLLINNTIEYLSGPINGSTLKMTIESFTDQTPGITLTGLRYYVSDSNNKLYYGYLKPSVVLTYPGTPQNGSSYDIFAYWRSVLLDTESIVYANGIRTNPNQTSIIETTVTNNIEDPYLNEEISARYSLELTFVVVLDGEQVPSLSEWNSPVRIASVVLNSNLESLVNNAFSLISTSGTGDGVSWEAFSILGCRNICVPYNSYKLPNGIVYTLNKDYSVTGNGLSVSTSNYYIMSNLRKNIFEDKFILSGVPSDAPVGCVIKQEIRSLQDDSYLRGVEAGPGEDVTTLPFDENTEYTNICIEVAFNTVLDNVTFYPMIRYIKDNSSEYVRPSMTNTELTYQKGNFLGTIDEWDKLPLFEKVTYETADIIQNPIGTLKFSSDGNFVLRVDNPGWDGTIEYSMNTGTSWATWDGSVLVGSPIKPIYLRGTGNTVITGNPSKSWVFTGKYCTGNIETLLDYQTVINGEHPIMNNGCYEALFMGSSLITAPELPAITLTSQCYYSMFQGCTLLTTAPELLALTLAESCYSDMFAYCTSLTTPPNLPATTLATSCYHSMFEGCTSLITAPELSAIILADDCYTSMFKDCTALTIPPELPATTLEVSCYSSMFLGCTSLTTAPDLPATTLADYCYYGMFNGCTALTTLPDLLATTLANECYKYMFGHCSNIKLSTTQTGEYQYEYGIFATNATDALEGMFDYTGGTFTGTPSLNTTYYTDHAPV